MAVELLAALPQLRQLVDPGVASLEALDDLLQLLLRLLERRLSQRSLRSCLRRRARRSCRPPRPPPRHGRRRRRGGRLRSRARAPRAERVRRASPCSVSSRARLRSSASSGARWSRSCVVARRWADLAAASCAPRCSATACAFEAVAQFGDVGDDEPCGGGRRRGANVGGQVAERCVLLVADRGDDRHRALGDRPHDAFVRERQQVLEAPAAAREHDHVGAALAEVADRGRDRRSRARALHVRLGDERRSQAESAARCVSEHRVSPRRRCR